MKHFVKVGYDELDEDHKEVYDRIWDALEGMKAKASLDVLLNATVVVALKIGIEDGLIEAVQTTLDVLKDKVKPFKEENPS